MRMVIIILALVCVSGCAGTGFNKKADLMFDEIEVAPNLKVDTQGKADKPVDLDSVKVGFKWKFK